MCDIYRIGLDGAMVDLDRHLNGIRMPHAPERSDPTMWHVDNDILHTF